MDNVLNQIGEYFPQLLQWTLTHLWITAIAVIFASIFGLSVGILISEKKWLAKYVIPLVNVIYTIPSIALLGVLIGITGIGDTTAVIALTLYGLLPIVRSTYVGITEIDPRIIEAGTAMGSSELETLVNIKIPLALPVILASIRNMVTMTIALASIASFVGAGGLGIAIYRGITTNNRFLLFGGSAMVAILAIVIDMSLDRLGKQLAKNKYRLPKHFVRNILVLIVMTALIFTGMQYNTKKTIHIASKPTTEGYILAELVSQLIEQDLMLEVDLTHGVGGGTANLHPALVSGKFDMYPEYTGTGWQIVLQDETAYTEEKFSELKQKYEEAYQITWMGMFGFNDTYGIAVRKEIAEKYQLKTISDLAKVSNDLIFGAEYDFFERQDGYDALQQAYGLRFAKKVDMDNGLKYQSIFDGKIDVMTVFTTDGQVSSDKIVVLEDDRRFYPSYYAGMVVRQETLKKYPKLEATLNKLNGILNEEKMAELNYRVEIDKQTPSEVAKEYLMEKGLLRK